MTAVFITIGICIVGIIGTVIVAKKTAKDDKTKRLWLLLAAIGTIAVHYSSIPYHAIGHLINPERITTAEQFLRSNPNLVLPIYPCNVMMWFCLIIGLFKNEKSPIFKFLVDFVFLFGIVSGIVGMFANGDYFNPNVVKDYDICKSAVAHAVMIVNILLLPLFGYFKFDPLKNYLRCFVGIIFMAINALFCDVFIYFYGGLSTVLSWNAMFLFKSPIDGISIFTYPCLAPIFLIVLFIVLTILEFFLHKKEERWFAKH